MKLLILTQKVDRTDTVLGFFHLWIERFSRRFDSILVCCLERGLHELPSNVEVASLGKEQGSGKLGRLWRLLALVWKRRHEYDAVFVHMNQEYVLVAGLFWRLLGKRVVMWRNHPLGSVWTTIACWLCDVVMYTSERSYTARFKNARQMPAGIDTELFVPPAAEEPRASDFLYVGRISWIKHVTEMIEAFSIVSQRRPGVRCVFYGDVSAAESEYDAKVRALAAPLVERGVVVFNPGVAYERLPAVYASATALINLTPAGSLDKVALEMMACEGLVLFSNESFLPLVPEGEKAALYAESTEPAVVAKHIEAIASMDDRRRSALGRNLRDAVVRTHSLDALVEEIRRSCDRPMP
jgi:glycosyltransferase involved in cell wall biosynthesis